MRQLLIWTLASALLGATPSAALAVARAGPDPAKVVWLRRHHVTTYFHPMQRIGDDRTLIAIERSINGRPCGIECRKGRW